MQIDALETFPAESKEIMTTQSPSMRFVMFGPRTAATVPASPNMIRKTYSDSFSADTDHKSGVGINNESDSPMNAAVLP